MSTTIHWEPAPPHPSGRTIGSTKLKYILASRYWPNEGRSLVHASPVTLGIADRSYIQGLVDGEVEGAKELLSILDANGAIEIWIAE